MRIYIGPCGLGLGHITRCETIAREFARRGDDVVFSSYLDGLEYLKSAGLRHFSAVPISFRTREDGTVDPKLTATQNGVTVGLWKFVKQLVAEVRQIVMYNPDIVISDTRVSTLLAGRILRRPTCLILNQYSVQMPIHAKAKGVADGVALYFARIIWKYAAALLGLAWGMSDVIIVPDLKPPYTISRYNLNIPRRISKKVRLVGPIGGRNLKGIPNGTPKLKEPPGVSVFACVSGPATDRKYLVRLLSRVLKGVPQEWDVVLSCGDPNGSPFPRHVENLTVFDWMEEDAYNELFQRADVLVSRAGHETIMKAVCAGKPIVLVPPPNHTEQGNNARRAVELGVGVALDQANLNTETLVNAVRWSLEKDAERALEISRAIGGQGGAPTVVHTVYHLADN